MSVVTIWSVFPNPVTYIALSFVIHRMEAYKIIIFCYKVMIIVLTSFHSAGCTTVDHFWYFLTPLESAAHDKNGI